MPVSETLLRRLYPEERYNGTKRFYREVRRWLTPESRVLNLGAGPATESPIRTLKGEVAEVVGADVDRCVFDNPELDRAVLIEDGRLPFEDAYFDLILSDYVFEHVENPTQFLAEAARVLKPGGSFLFRTPNITHYLAIISAITPHRVHSRIANAVRANPDGSQEPWRTCYRLNSPGALRRMGRTVGLGELVLEFVETEPTYLKFSTPLFLGGVAYERLVNATPLLAGLRANLFGRFIRDGGPAAPEGR